MKNVLALDPGYGNTKVCVNCLTASMQSAIARPQATGMATADEQRPPRRPRMGVHR